MTPDQVAQQIGFLGVCVQFASAVLLSVLFFLLRRHALRRAYFAMWARAWLALTVAMAAVVLMTSPALADNLPVDSAKRFAFRFAYQYSKLLYCALLIAGTRVYAYGSQSRSLYMWGVFGSAAYAAIGLGFLNNIVSGVAIQAPAVVGSFAYCAATLLRLPNSRRSLGSTATGGIFAGVALLWAIYFFALTDWWVPFFPALVGPLQAVAEFNPHIDALLQMLLGSSMIVMLMEDAAREADAARAELAVAHDKLRRDALYDSLTGTLNRRAFVEGVGLEMAKASFGAVVVLDMDNLKTVNDGAGHAAGDELLQHLTTTLRGVIRPTDRLYRWGGDEFLLIFPGARSGDVQGRIEEAIINAEPLFVDPARPPIRLVASVGSAEYVSGEDMSQAIERADGVMYRQKKARRARERGAALTSGTHERYVGAPTPNAHPRYVPPPTPTGPHAKYAPEAPPVAPPASASITPPATKTITTKPGASDDQD